MDWRSEFPTAKTSDSIFGVAIQTLRAHPARTNSVTILRPAVGTVRFQGTDLRKITRRETAKRIALVPQELNLQFGFTVAQMVMLGRTPHASAFSGAAKHDHAVV